MDNEILIEARGLKKHFPIRGGLLKRELGSVKAVDGVDVVIRRGETLGLVGESGCGKTTAGRCLLMLAKPTAGNIYFKLPADVREKILQLEDEIAKAEKEKDQSSHKLREEYERLNREYALNRASPPPGVPERLAQLKDEVAKAEKEKDQALAPLRKEYEELNQKHALNHMKREELRAMRREMQIVFQDPFSSLDPRQLVKDIIGEPLKVHDVAKGEEALERVTALMEKVGLNPEHLYRFPHEFSGGQRQRIGVARALALNPDLLVLDEPTSALDVSVQAQILNMLNDLQRDLGLTYLFISHDLSTIRYMCDRVSVMYLGKVVETAPKEALFGKPLHPYTEALLSVIPVPDPSLKKNRIVLAGDVPSPAKPPSGCRFHTRCRFREPICEEVDPPLVDKGGEHFVACHFR